MTAAGNAPLLGIDGGGTKTEFVLFTPSGRVLRRLVLGGTNPNSVGLDSALNTLAQGIGEMRAHAPALRFVHAGIAGCSNPSHQSAIRAHVHAFAPEIEFSIESDTLNVMASAECGDTCITAICGTGSVVFAKESGGLHRLGGWGYRFDQGGSGYEIGRDAVQAVLAQYEQLGPETALKDLLEEQIGGNLWLNVHALYAMPPEKIAALAPCVLNAWKAGDGVAAQILQKNMDRLAFLITAAAQRYDCGNTLVLSGGLTARTDMLETFLYPKLPASLTPVVPPLPQIYGACVLCAQKAGDIPEGFRTEFERSYLSEKGENHPC
ncbi:MAG: hypothetical protein IJB41_03045 [Clostridia bacterium]|nr:hypothetical protein [Clostridia bacterium]